MLITKFKNREGIICYTQVEVEMKDLVGVTLTKAYKSEHNDQITLECEYGQFIFDHQQDCCESVYIESVVGDFQDLIGEPLLVAEEVVSNNEEAYESGTWTFYKFATRKGYVDVRWLGESNGYYSESVDLRFIALPGVILEDIFDVTVNER